MVYFLFVIYLHVEQLQHLSFQLNSQYRLQGDSVHMLWLPVHAPYFLMQLSFLLQGGMYVFQLLDYYACNGACIVFICVFQCLAVAWVFGGLNISTTQYNLSFQGHGTVSSRFGSDFKLYMVQNQFRILKQNTSCCINNS